MNITFKQVKEILTSADYTHCWELGVVCVAYLPYEPVTGASEQLTLSGCDSYNTLKAGEWEFTDGGGSTVNILCVNKANPDKTYTLFPMEYMKRA